jgi:hypothetical protein
MSGTEYWATCISEALEDCGGTLTPEQITAVASSCAIAHENYGLAFYQPRGDSQDRQELGRIQELLRQERSKVTCRECNGVGSITSYGPSHGSTSRCWKCNGEGRHVP